MCILFILIISEIAAYPHDSNGVLGINPNVEIIYRCTG